MRPPLALTASGLVPAVAGLDPEDDQPGKAEGSGPGQAEGQVAPQGGVAEGVAVVHHCRYCYKKVL